MILSPKDEALKQMVLSKLKIGMVVKNYRAMCALLNQDIKEGNSRKAQIKQWERFFSYTKDKNKFCITAIHGIPTAKVDKRITSDNKNAIYQKLFEVILLDLLASNENNELIVTKQDLFVKLGMVSPNYIDNDYKKSLYTASIDESCSYTSHDINIFDNRSYQILNKILFRVLDQLQRRFVIRYERLTYIEMMDESNQKITWIANDQEKDAIMQVKYSALQELDEECNTSKFSKGGIQSVAFYGRSKEFYKKVNKSLNQLYGWSNTYNLIKINYNRAPLLQTYTKSIDELQSIDLTKLELNSKIVNAIDYNALYNYDKLSNAYQSKYDEIYTLFKNDPDYNVWMDDRSIREEVESQLKVNKVFKPKDGYVLCQKELSNLLINLNNTKQSSKN